MPGATAEARPAAETVKVSAAQVGKLIAAQARYSKRKAEAEKAKGERDKLLDALAAKLPIGEWVEFARWAIRVTKQNSGDSFSLAKYVEAGNKVTPEMQEFVSEGTDYPRLWVRPAAKD